jgi:hypothetical protein
MTIQNDSEFRSALSGLSVAEQRRLAARFTESVAALCKDPRVSAAISAAGRADVSDGELAMVYQAAKSANVESYTQCGREADWLGQAGHFVAEAAMTCVTPAAQARNLAWEAAMRARMARTCEAIARGQGTENREAEQQYRMVEELRK